MEKSFKQSSLKLNELYKFVVEASTGKRATMTSAMNKLIPDSESSSHRNISKGTVKYRSNIYSPVHLKHTL